MRPTERHTVVRQPSQLQLGLQDCSSTIIQSQGRSLLDGRGGAAAPSARGVCGCAASSPHRAAMAAASCVLHGSTAHPSPPSAPSALEFGVDAAWIASARASKQAVRRWGSSECWETGGGLCVGAFLRHSATCVHGGCKETAEQGSCMTTNRGNSYQTHTTPCQQPGACTAPLSPAVQRLPPRPAGRPGRPTAPTLPQPAALCCCGPC